MPRVLHLLSQRPSLTGSGVTLDALVGSGAIAARALDLLTDVMQRRLSMLVTGGTGFIGRHVLSALRAAQLDVHATHIDIRST